MIQAAEVERAALKRKLAELEQQHARLVETVNQVHYVRPSNVFSIVFGRNGSHELKTNVSRMSVWFH